MQFELNITLTEEDYLAFNHFHALESANGKKQLMKVRIFFTAFIIVLIALVLFICDCSPISIAYAIVLGLFTLVYMLLYKKVVKRNINGQIKRLKKAGKLPFDLESKLEFYDDKLVEITTDRRVEQSYTAIERICVVKNQYIFLYNSSVGAYMLPIPQLQKQLNQDNFLRFLSSKCSTVENY